MEVVPGRLEQLQLVLAFGLWTHFIEVLLGSKLCCESLEVQEEYIRHTFWQYLFGWMLRLV